jgi:Icc-related predicted phosphoesterase
MPLCMEVGRQARLKIWCPLGVWVRVPPAARCPNSRNKMKIAYISDLHIDMHRDQGCSFFDSLEMPECDMLVVAGDLLVVAEPYLWSTVASICRLAPKVLWVTGNHEYYEASLSDTDSRLQEVADKNPNLTIASKVKTIDIDGVSFLAGTMWFPYRHDHDLYKRYMNDFGWIQNLEPEVYDRNREFDIALHGIKDERCVVVTHHLPSAQGINPRFAASCLNRFFVGGEFYHVIKNSQIVAWIHGHSHEPVEYKIGHTRILANPLGYPNEIKRNWRVKVVDV